MTESSEVTSETATDSAVSASEAEPGQAMSKQEIVEKIRAVMVDFFELDASEISEDSNLVEDLDIDSIDTIDLMIEMRKHLDKEIDDMALLDCKTIGDVAEVISKM
ncbi:MAG: phosphopantetheine-binding protein [Pseudomonadota bacterium]